MMRRKYSHRYAVAGIELFIADMHGHFRKAPAMINQDVLLLDKRQYKRFVLAMRDVKMIPGKRVSV